MLSPRGAETAAFRDRSFHFVHVSHVLEHVADRLKAISELEHGAARLYRIPAGLV
jgi:hypothetical protein